MAVRPRSVLYTMCSSQKLSSCQSLAERKNKDGRAECDVCVASRPTTHNTTHLFSLLRLMVPKSHGEDAAVAAFGVTHPTTGSESLQHPHVEQNFGIFQD